MGFPSGIWCGGFGRQRIDVGLLECLVKIIIMAVVVVAIGGGVMACRMWVRDDRKRSMRRGSLKRGQVFLGHVSSIGNIVIGP